MQHCLICSVQEGHYKGGWQQAQKMEWVTTWCCQMLAGGGGSSSGGESQLMAEWSLAGKGRSNAENGRD